MHMLSKDITIVPYLSEKSADLHKAFHLCFVPGLRNGAISGVPLISDSPGHFNQESKF